MSCSICGATTNKENAPILAMGGFGNPRYVCDCCAEELEVVTEGMDPEKINLAINSLVEKISKRNTDDPVTIDTLSGILKEAKERVELIEAGEYTVDESPDDESDGHIPEELVETEQDRALDEADAKKNAKLQKVLDFVTFGIIGAAVIALILYFVIIK